MNVSTWAPLTSSSRHGAKYDDSTSEEEDEDESCYGDSEDEDNYADVKGQLLPRLFVRRPFVLAELSISLLLGQSKVRVIGSCGTLYCILLRC